ncbi:Phosphomevalonate/mevalonate kinase [Candidatus Trichorickettsia mobilis]|uniref:mevalonate kinase n=1 Tax=Candidatus Trichorickettsia mobilis TaxID=1346319 RepID=A0ABZ0UW72_9RICK|nr:mevalonate kinase [Candidatus Trichorickettsia mobilis]WPY01347.1 Phosphomevalonate/mevalonate kinase [Candidatus Trichorickettsia mobilis]
MRKQIVARAPAKLILSGEHAVVYGKPALAMAINRYTESTIISSLSPTILFNCLNLNHVQSLTVCALKALKQRVQDKYNAFLEDGSGIREVIKMPFELLQYTVIHLLETLDISIAKGLKIRASSDIPIGCGMGSSAALIMSTLYALVSFFKLEIDHIHFLALGRKLENLQHGYSSGLDIHVAMTGGCVKFEEGRISNRIAPNIPMAIVQTGTPNTTTGQCVSFVANIFKNSSIDEDFKAVTETFDEALNYNNLAMIQNSIKLNHRLLAKIGVVPPRIQDFINTVEKNGGAAKICGAGAIEGDKAGVVLIVSERDLSSIAKDYGYVFEQVQVEHNGAHTL